MKTRPLGQKRRVQTPEQEAVLLQVNRMTEYLERIRVLIANRDLTTKQRQELVAEELVLLQECNKSAMRLVFKL